MPHAHALVTAESQKLKYIFSSAYWSHGLWKYYHRRSWRP